MANPQPKNPATFLQHTSPSRRRTSLVSLLPRKTQANTQSNSNNQANDGAGGAKIQTLTACNRCRSRKSRCDATLPKCEPCQRSGSVCEFWDAGKRMKLSRDYVIFLQNKVRELDQEVKQLEKDRPQADQPDEDDLVRSMGMVSLSDEEPERHFLGSSAGLQLARLVVEFAKKNTVTHSVNEIVPPFEHESARFQAKERRPSSTFSLSSAPVDKLPKRELTDKLVSEFIFKRAQFMLPTLHETTFMNDADEVYAGSTDPHKNFVVKMVLAISMQKIGSQYSGLADGFYLAALRHLEAVIAAMNLYTLQCFCLMGQYSLLTPTRTGIYHIIGLATRLCIDLGLTQESTITKDIYGRPLDPLTIDMRRRLFWVTSSMESGLSHILGRPSGFSTGDTFTDVQFFQPYDDSLITKDGILPGPISTKKLVSRHFFRMRRIQAEIRLVLYQNLKETPRDDRDPWFKQLYAKLDEWINSAPVNGEGSGLSLEWFRHRYNNMLIFLYRPSPQIPKPSIDATILCYDCAIKNIQIQKKMFDERSVDMTWVLVHQVYMTCIIMMWCLSCEEIRQIHPRNEVAKHIYTGLECLDLMVERWPGVGSAREIFFRLSLVALQSYESVDSESTSTSQNTASNIPPANHTKPPHTLKSSLSEATGQPRSSLNAGSPATYISPPQTPPTQSPTPRHSSPPHSRGGSLQASSASSSHPVSMNEHLSGSFSNNAPILQYLPQAYDNNQYNAHAQSPPPRMNSQSPSISSTTFYGSSSPNSPYANPPTPGAVNNDDNSRGSFSNYTIGNYDIGQSNIAMGPSNNIQDLSQDIVISPSSVLPNQNLTSMATLTSGMPDMSYQQGAPLLMPTIAEDPSVQYNTQFQGSNQMYNFYPPADVSNLLSWTATGQMDMYSSNPYSNNSYRMEMDVIDPEQAIDLMMSLENQSQGDIFSGIPFTTGSYL